MVENTIQENFSTYAGEGIMSGIEKMIAYKGQRTQTLSTLTLLTSFVQASVPLSHNFTIFANKTTCGTECGLPR